MIGKKIGMTQIFNEAGDMFGVTVVESDTAPELKAGDLVRVSGKTIGKGFQGTVKRYHHHRGPMSHGSKSHRLVGSIGSGTTPGRVWKGRRMPGRMGGGRATVKNLQVVSVMPEQKLVLLYGSVPGKKGNRVEIVKC